MSTRPNRSAFLVLEPPTMRELVRTVIEPLTLVLALSLGAFGVLMGWQAHAYAVTAPNHPPLAAERYVEALCREDVAYLQRKTGEATGPMPWEPRLSTWVRPCTGYRYLGESADLIGRAQYVFALLRPDGGQAVYVITFGRDGLVAGVD